MLKDINMIKLKETPEYKDVEAIKFSDKTTFTDEEVKHVIFTVIMMRIAMLILDKLGLLHNPILDQAKSYIKPGVATDEFFNEIMKGIYTLKNKQRSIPLAKRKLVLDEISKLITYQNRKHKKRKNHVLKHLIQRDRSY